MKTMIRTTFVFFAFVVILSLQTTAVANAQLAAQPVAQAVFARTVFLGDSITDGDTYPQLVRDSLSDKGQMVAICAGIGGNTIKQMRARLDRDVLAFHPTMVTINAGANDSHQGVTAADFENDLREIVKVLLAKNITVILTATNIQGPSNADVRPLLAAYDAAVYDTAGTYNLRVAEANKCQNAAAAQGISQICSDDLHPNYEGQRSIAHALLNAMGYSDVAVVLSVRAIPNKGIIPLWKIRPLAAGEPALTDTSIASIKLDASWTTLRLPQPPLQLVGDQLASLKWLDDLRAEGAAVELDKLLGPADHYVAVAKWNSNQSTDLQFHTGCGLESLWLNGTRIYTNDNSHGFHPGRESVAATVVKGENSLVAQCGTSFYLSITDGPFE
jgi:lysophospholipase L1-like esterase